MDDKQFSEEFDERLKQAEEKFNEVIDSKEVSNEFLNIRKKARRKFDQEIEHQLDEITKSTKKVEKAMEKLLSIIEKNNSSSEE